MKDKINLADRLAELLVEKNINCKILSQNINISRPTISRWKSDKMSMSLASALKVVDYFNCSLDFLTGRSDIVLDYSPKECPLFFPHLMELIKKHGIRRIDISNNTRIKSAHLVDWSRGKNPHIELLIDLADYLDITLDELVGRDR